MNISEKTVKDELERRGFAVYRNGWPDFLAVKRIDGGSLNGRLGVMGIEVKNKGDKLSESQTIIHRVLRQARLPIHVVSPLEVKEASLSSRSLLTQGDIDYVRTTANSISVEIERLQKQLQDLNNVIEGTHFHLHTVGPLLTLKEI
jgi:hypothetical protein